MALMQDPAGYIEVREEGRLWFKYDPLRHLIDIRHNRSTGALIDLARWDAARPADSWHAVRACRRLWFYYLPAQCLIDIKSGDHKHLIDLRNYGAQPAPGASSSGSGAGARC